MDFFPHSEGYVKATESGSQLNFNYVFNFTDHLGNIRLKYTEHPQTGELEILEENHYYPYGLTHQGYNGEHRIVGLEQPGTPITLIPVTPGVIDTYKYKFGGMEYSDEFDINTYDFGARNYDPALGRWMNIDPLAEMMRRHSPYNYAFNNPNYFIDPDGMAPGGFANINPVTSTGAMEVSDFGGGNESGALKSGGGGDVVNPNNPIQMDEVVVVGKKNKGVDGGMALYGNGTEDLGHKDGTTLGDMDINQLPTIPGSGSTGNRIMDWLRKMIELFSIKEKIDSHLKPNESTMENRTEEPEKIWTKIDEIKHVSPPSYSGGGRNGLRIGIGTKDTLIKTKDLEKVKEKNKNNLQRKIDSIKKNYD